MGYCELLLETARKAGNCACMGIDPSFPALPEGMTVSDYYISLFEEMDRRNLKVAAFKPNIGYFQRLDRPLDGTYDGSGALGRIIRNLPRHSVMILDSKRGDIASSSLNYACEAYECWNADAVTVSPYMGHDSVSPFVTCYPDKGIYVLCRTSNPGGKDLQNRIMDNGKPLYMTVAETIEKWNREYPGTLGAVVGATNMKEFSEISEFLQGKSVPLLIPGVGSQGGSAEEVMKAMKESGYMRELSRINSSSALTHPWAKKKEAAPRNWKEVCISAIEKFIGECSL